MPLIDDENPFGAPPRRPPTHHELGQPLDALSIDELGARIEVLRAEIVRIEQAIAVKQATKHAADTFFRS